MPVSGLVASKPIMKWAGGKTQMLRQLLPLVPDHYGKYIEPFFGGGALFFAIQPKKAVISDSNPELINLYKQVAHSVDEIIARLQSYDNNEELYYAVRAQDWTTMSPVEAAARTLFLNRTCYNGLYRVNRRGQFNTPFGKYKNPKICDEDALRKASLALRSAEIICGDYLDVLAEHAKEGDFVFLDPPYVPISAYSDFKRYTPEQFYEEDHRNLAMEVKRLCDLGCHVVLTNSDHPLVHELYSGYEITVVETKRAISSKGTSRRGKDVIVRAEPKVTIAAQAQAPMSEPGSTYPPTRFMGSKSKILGNIWSATSGFSFDSVLDLFSGSGAVGYMFKCHGKQVISNDYMAMSATFAKAMIENNSTLLAMDEARELLAENDNSDHFVEETFSGLYFTDADNRLIDTLRANIWRLNDEYKRAIALTALIRACIKKRPRGIFTYTGNRYNDGRRDLLISFEQQFLEAVEAVNGAVFDNHKKNIAIWGDALEIPPIKPDLVYIDPPYYSPLSDNEYVRRYHFVEGLARDWRGVDIQQHTKTKKFKSYPTPFSKKDGATAAFDELFSRYRESIIVVSYSSNSLPTKEELAAILSKYKEDVEIIPIDYTYSFGNQSDAQTNNNSVKEYIFVGHGARRS